MSGNPLEQLVEETLGDLRSLGGSLMERAQGNDRVVVEDLLRILGVKYAEVALSGVGGDPGVRKSIQHAENSLKVIALRYQVEASSHTMEFLERLSGRVARFAVSAALGAL